ncbi:hypothetical protein SteCoe_36192 [Stentor coeruleus]|uniref:Phosphatidic acid phosphatase type 2/haloperoxidase domain-containing protein n=1 Tax=Stentor coeruleus TaxID=5963 RepID=A0A1R2AQM8_9CILI|nr:hypothetical protein SteCoe_36192 [Stentor coeruleus]
MKGRNNVKISVTFKIISAMLVVFVIPFQVILKKPLMKGTIDFITWIQHRRTHSGIYFFELFQYFGDGTLLNVVGPIIYNFLHPKRSSVIIISSTIVHFFGNFFGTLLQEERPFWYSSKVRPELCSKGYGNPSMTILITATFMPMLFIELFHKHKYRWVGYSLLIFIILMGSISRVYLGGSFPHQVIITLFLAFSFVTLYFSLNKDISKLCFNSCYGYYKNRMYLVKWVIFSFALMILEGIIELVIYVTPSNYAKIISNAVTHCDVNYNPNGKYNLQNSLEIFFGVGFAFGCMLSSKYLSIYWITTEWWKRIFRAILASGINFGIIVGFNYISTDNFFSEVVVHHIVPNFLCGFLFTGFMPFALYKTSLIGRIKPIVDTEHAISKFEDKAII